MCIARQKAQKFLSGGLDAHTLQRCTHLSERMHKFCWTLFFICAATACAIPTKSTNNYVAERYALAAKPDYDANKLGMAVYALLEVHHQRGGDSKFSFTEVHEPLEQAHKIDPLSITVNLTIANFLEYAAGAKGEIEQKQRRELLEIARLKREKAEAILSGILASGDGKTPETAYQVINIKEEYEVLQARKLTREEQSVVKIAGKPFDLLLSRDANGKQHKIYFDISRFYREEQSAKSKA